jgi:seryl-tRNA(Sec) selenium transferase
MISTILNLQGTDAAVSTASTIGSASLVRVYNNNGAAVLLTVTTAAAATTTVTIAPGEVLYLEKAPASTITAATSCRMVSVGY